MKFYVAPLEGITGHVFRNAHHKFYKGVDRYFAPFLSTNQLGTYKPRDWKDLLPENNENIILIPQILTNQADQFSKATRDIYELGYHEVNLNLGCPSGTVVSKRKGSGLLGYIDELEIFLSKIFEQSKVEISIKTRIGLKDPDEFKEILAIYNKFPVKELIIHPRVRTDFYNNEPNWNVFMNAINHSRVMPCYNGDIFTLEDFMKWQEKFPQIDKVMLGRGMIQNPDLIAQCKERQVILDREKLRAFHDELFIGYQREMSGETPTLFKMKELWFYLHHSFTDNKKALKTIQKAKGYTDYMIGVNTMFQNNGI